MQTVKDVLEHAKWLIEKGRGEEPASLFLPRVTAQRRRVNREGYRRFIIQVDEQLYSDLHGQRERYLQLCNGNPPIAYAIMLRILGAVSDEAIQGLAQEGNDAES